jgi:hypothetical protein
MNPRESALPRPVAMRLAATEYDRCAQMFRSLSPPQWAMPTGCPAWDVRQMAGHMLACSAGMAAELRRSSSHRSPRPHSLRLARERNRNNVTLMRL